VPELAQAQFDHGLELRGVPQQVQRPLDVDGERMVRARPRHGRDEFSKALGLFVDPAPHGLFVPVLGLRG